MSVLLKFIKKQYKIIILLSVITGAVYWIKFSPVHVISYKVTNGKINEEVMGTGTLDAKLTAVISPEVSGRIEKIFVDQGDKIKKNEILVQLDNDEYELKAFVEKAKHETALASLEKLKSDYKYAQVVFENKRSNYKRYKKLISKNAVSQKQYDEVVKSYGMAKAKLNRAKLALIEADKKIHEAERSYQLSLSELDKTTIKAPFAGIITYRNKEPGDTVVPSSPILELVSKKVLWVRAWVNEVSLSKLELGQKASVIFRSEPTKTYHGEVARIANKVDPETREFIVDVKLVNLPRNWAIGQRAEVYIETRSKDNVVSIPRVFLTWNKKREGVYVDTNGKASWLPVKTGISNDKNIEITEGLKPGQCVVRSAKPKITLTNNIRIKNESGI